MIDTYKTAKINFINSGPWLYAVLTIIHGLWVDEIIFCSFMCAFFVIFAYRYVCYTRNVINV